MSDIVLGNGDDCAIISLPEGSDLAQSIDTYVAGVHFLVNAPAELIAWRTLAASVSDLAAMGATPHSFSLALTLPEINNHWLKCFSKGLAQFAKIFNMTLVGGDTTKGPLSISYHVQGFVPSGKALMRSGAKPGDHIYVSGTLGNAGAALPLVSKGLVFDDISDKSEKYLLEAYYYPMPQVELGQWLSGKGGTTAIDISDGLLADLSHLLEVSNTGAKIAIDEIPLSTAILNCYPKQKAINFALTSGDDYQLCFIWPSDKIFPEHCPIPVKRIGYIHSVPGIKDENNNIYSADGFKHF